MRTETVIAFLLAASGPAVPVPADSDATALASRVLAEAREAIGGTARLQAVRSLSVAASFRRADADGMSFGEIEIVVAEPERFRRIQTQEMGGGTASLSRGVVLNGEEAGYRIFGTGLKTIHQTPLSPERKTVLAAQLREERARYLLSFLLRADSAAAYVGEAQAPDGRADVIGFESPVSARLFIDKKSRRPLMLSYKGQWKRAWSQKIVEDGKVRLQGGKSSSAVPSVESEVEIRFGGYKAVDGVWLPHQISIAVAGETVEEWELTFKVNPTPRADDFKPTAG